MYTKHAFILSLLSQLYSCILSLHLRVHCCHFPFHEIWIWATLATEYISILVYIEEECFVGICIEPVLFLYCSMFNIIFFYSSPVRYMTCWLEYVLTLLANCGSRSKEANPLFWDGHFHRTLRTTTDINKNSIHWESIVWHTNKKGQSRSIYYLIFGIIMINEIEWMAFCVRNIYAASQHYSPKMTNWLHCIGTMNILPFNVREWTVDTLEWDEIAKTLMWMLLGYQVGPERWPNVKKKSKMPPKVAIMTRYPMLALDCILSFIIIFDGTQKYARSAIASSRDLLVLRAYILKIISRVRWNEEKIKNKKAKW